MRISTLVMGVILFGLLCVMAALWSCDGGLSPSNIASDLPAELDGIRIYTASEAYPPDAGTITLIIENKTGSEIAYGLEWSAEVKRGETWYKLPFVEPVTIPDIARTVSDGEAGSLTVDLSTLDFKLTPGNYRIIKNVSGVTLAAEFKVEENAAGEMPTE